MNYFSKKCGSVIKILITLFFLINSFVFAGDVVSELGQNQTVTYELTGVFGQENHVVTYNVGDELKKVLDRKIRQLNIPGISLAILNENGELYTLTDGVADEDTNDNVTKDTLFKVGSITKTFISMTILQLIQEGKLSFDDTLGELLPDESKILSGFNPDNITIRQLLTHTSLICSFTETSGWAEVMQYKPTYQWSTDELLYTVSPYSQSDCNSPGQTWHYSNTNYVLLGKIIEKLTGHTWGYEVEERFIKPLGLTNTHIPSEESTYFEDLPNLAHGYINWQFETSPITDVTSINPTFTGSSGEIISTPTDLAKWVMAIAQGKVIDQDMLSKLVSLDSFVSTTYEGYFYSFGIMKIPGYNVAGHAGGHPGFDCTMQYIGGEDDVVAICSNRTYGDRQKTDTAILYSVLKVLYPYRDLEPLPKTFAGYEYPVGNMSIMQEY